MSIKKILLDYDIQASAPRLAVADYVLSTKDHPTAEEVKTQVEKRMPTVSTATIYNTLNLFVEKGLLKVVPDPLTEKQRYDANTQAHFHFYDEDTGRLVDLDPSLLRVSPNFSKLNAEFEVKQIEVMLRGRLKRSLKNRNKSNSKEGETYDNNND